MKSWEEFRSSTLKLTDSRHHKITNSIGVYDIYKMIRKSKWEGIGHPISEHIFYSVIRGVNKLLAEELVKGNDVTLPCRMGRLEIRKYKANIYFDGEKIKTNLPIDWDRTLRLWHSDEESYKNKTLIKMEEKELFKVYYNRNIANYNNKTFFSFNVNREIKRRLKSNIKDKLVDAYEMGRTAF